MPLPASRVGKAGAHREAAADALGDRHDVRLDARALVGKQLAGPAHAASGLRRRSEAGHARRRVPASRAGTAAARCRTPPSPWIGSIRIAAVSGRDRGFKRLMVAERDLVEAIDLGTEAFEIFLLPACGDGRQRAAVERAFEGNDAKALGLAVGRSGICAPS